MREQDREHWRELDETGRAQFKEHLTYVKRMRDRRAATVKGAATIAWLVVTAVPAWLLSPYIGGGWAPFFGLWLALLILTAGKGAIWH